MHPSRLRLGPSQSRPLTDASPGSGRSPGLRVVGARAGAVERPTHAPFRTECQSFLRCQDTRLTISRKLRSGYAAAPRRQRPEVRILSGLPARARRSPQSVVSRLSDKRARVACASRLPSGPRMAVACAALGRLTSTLVFGRNAQIAAIRRWRGDRGSARARALIGLISL